MYKDRRNGRVHVISSGAMFHHNLRRKRIAFWMVTGMSSRFVSVQEWTKRYFTSISAVLVESQQPAIPECDHGQFMANVQQSTLGTKFAGWKVANGVERELLISWWSPLRFCLRTWSKPLLDQPDVPRRRANTKIVASVIRPDLCSKHYLHPVSRMMTSKACWQIESSRDCRGPEQISFGT